MKIKLLFFLFCALGPSSLLPAQTGSWADKVDPVVLDDLQESGRARVLVLMREQADVSGADELTSRREKGNFVYEKLYLTAVRSQQRIQLLLEAENHPYLSFYLVNALALTAEEPLLRRLAGLPEVAEIIEDQTFVLETVPESSGPVQSRTAEWGIANIMADSVWSAYGITGAGVVVGGQDTGYDWDHPALINQYRGYSPGNTNHNYNWHDAIHNAGSGNPCGSNSPVPCDDDSHGTHTMGTMVGDDGAGNQIGVAPGAQWIGCRNMDEGVGTLSTYLECFEWFLAPYPVGGNPGQGNPSKAPHVINNSWACPPSEGCNSSNWGTMEIAITNLLAAGVMVVASAGNRGLFGCESVEYPPAIFAGSFTVGATQSNDFIANFSSRGPAPNSGLMKPDICAPGVGIRSCMPGTGYGDKSGTSMAGPHVAGLVALLLEADPGLSIGSLQSVIESTARPQTIAQTCGGVPGSQVPNNTYGHGIINAAAAVEDVLGILPVEWLNFEGRFTASGVELNWQTLSEQHNARFEIQRSAEGEQWTVIGQTPGRGNSQSLQHYHFLDPTPFSPWSYYRLRQVDEDGSYAYSRTIAVQAIENQLRITFFPNPSTGTFQYQWHGPEGEDARLEIFDLQGRRIRLVEGSQRSGVLEIGREGLYFFRLSEFSSGRTLSGKLLVTP